MSVGIRNSDKQVCCCVFSADAEDPETTVSVLLDGEESMIEFVDEPNVSCYFTWSFVFLMVLEQNKKKRNSLRLLIHFWEHDLRFHSSMIKFETII